MSFLDKAEKVILADMGFTVHANLKPIHEFEFPEVVIARTKTAIGDTDIELVKIGFFDYFYAVQEHGKLEMTNPKVDELWHQLILDTKAYMKFCSEYVGFYVHHNPYVDKKELSSSKTTELNTKISSSISKNTRYSSYRDRYVDRDDDDVRDLMTYAAILSSCSSEDTIPSFTVTTAPSTVSSCSSCSSCRSSSTCSSSSSSSCSSGSSSSCSSGSSCSSCSSS